MKIKIKYIHENSNWYLEKLSRGNWIDLRAIQYKVNGIEQTSDKITYKAGDTVFINFGFSMELPEHYEAYIAPRSSTFKNFGLILSNHLGIIDTSYNGDGDNWLGMFIAIKDGSMERGDRVAQFRIQEKMPEFEFEIVDLLGNSNRKGYGSSGVK